MKVLVDDGLFSFFVRIRWLTNISSKRETVLMVLVQERPQTRNRVVELVSSFCGRSTQYPKNPGLKQHIGFGSGHPCVSVSGPTRARTRILRVVELVIGPLFLGASTGPPLRPNRGTAVS